MNNKIWFFVVSLAVVVLGGCTDDAEVGVVIQPEQDKIILRTDTFHVASENMYAFPISAQTDTMILGEFYDKKYGTMKADLLVQLAPPVNYQFPAESYNPTPDSLVMYLYYKTFVGSTTSPLEISVYEINKKSIEYGERYLSNLDVSEFTDKTILLGRSSITSVDQSKLDTISSTSGYVHKVRYKFSEAQLARFFAIPHSAYADEKAFLEEFKGVYITSEYGSSSMINLAQVDLHLHYHYTYDKNGKDTIVNTSIIYPANKEVRQLNRMIHPDLSQVVKERDSVNFIKTSGGIYPKITLPVGRINKRISDQISDKILMINSSTLIIEAVELDSSKLALAIPPYMMLIKRDKLDDFIKDNRIPDSKDSISVISSYSATNKAYMFDISYFLKKNLSEGGGEESVEELCLVPVDLTLSGQTSISRVRPQSKLGAVTIRSSKNSYSPMKVKLIYSGF